MGYLLSACLLALFLIGIHKIGEARALRVRIQQLETRNRFLEKELKAQRSQ